MVGYARLKLREPMVTHGNLWQPTNINEQQAICLTGMTGTCRSSVDKTALISGSLI